MIRIEDQERRSGTILSCLDITVGSQTQVGSATRSQHHARRAMLDTENLSFAKEQCICINLIFNVCREVEPVRRTKGPMVVAQVNDTPDRAHVGPTAAQNADLCRAVW